METTATANLTGHLATNPERVLDHAIFSLAVQKAIKYEFYMIKAQGKMAHVVMEYLKKGTAVTLEGELGLSDKRRPVINAKTINFISKK